MGKSSKIDFDSKSESESEKEGEIKKRKPRQSSWPNEDHVTFSMNDAKQFIYSFGFPKQKGSLKFVSVDLNDMRDSDSVYFTTNCKDYRSYFAPTVKLNERFAKYLNDEDAASFVAGELGRHDGCLTVFIKHTDEKAYVSIEDWYMNTLYLVGVKKNSEMKLCN